MRCVGFVLSKWYIPLLAVKMADLPVRVSQTLCLGSHIASLTCQQWACLYAHKKSEDWELSKIFNNWNWHIHITRCDNCSNALLDFFWMYRYTCIDFQWGNVSLKTVVLVEPRYSCICGPSETLSCCTPCAFCSHCNHVTSVSLFKKRQINQITRCTCRGKLDCWIGDLQ